MECNVPFEILIFHVKKYWDIKIPYFVRSDSVQACGCSYERIYQRHIAPIVLGVPVHAEIHARLGRTGIRLPLRGIARCRTHRDDCVLTFLHTTQGIFPGIV